MTDAADSRVQPAVELLAIGDELLIGATIDTNSTWIAQRLGEEGIRVLRKTTVGDVDAEIRNALEAALRRTHVVLCTGGLGPTRDDLTRDAAAAVFGAEQHIDEAWINELRSRYARRGIDMPEVNRVQALRPDGSRLLHNAIGTAPGVVLDSDDLGLCVLMPGVPSEMRGLMETHVVPLLREHLRVRGRIESRMLRTAGISEAALAERIDDIVQDVAPLTFAFLPHGSGVDLRVTAWGDVSDADTQFDRVLKALRERLGALVYTDDRTDLAVVVGNLLRTDGLTLALAESCTGGLIGKRLTDEPGASAFLLADIVSYHDDAKQKLLGVRAETLAAHGTVSEPCVREMALGALDATGADVAIAVTGIAGPGGATADKPVGLVWHAVAMSDDVARARGHRENIVTRRVVHPGDRTDVRDRSAQTALDMLRRALEHTDTRSDP